MKRYIHAFTMSLIVYLIGGFGLMYHTSFIHKPSSLADLSKEVMAITLYEPKKEEPELHPTPPPPSPPTLTHTPQKNVAKKESKTLPNAPVTKESMVVSQEREHVDLEEQMVTKEVKAEAMSMSSEVSSKEALHVKQKEYLENLKRRINEHKTYPKIAQNSRIEGNVMIEFTISPKGELLSFVVLGGKKIFHKATEDAVQKSFPFPLNEDLFTSVMTFQIELNYSLL
ncbi:energy transducer TonB [Sulfurospirillum oryzae]|uniref:energy transducer TonB n=1 Tax=Sulfurospirillum oryzae TaxID=2976535 RepID=UPI0021E6F2C8|nr:TonB family protein [Sulfurospirillum oryzae]